MNVEKLIERLEDRAGEDHKRGCEGRNYRCSCGFDAEWNALLQEAAAALAKLQAERDEAREALSECQSVMRAFMREADRGRVSSKTSERFERAASRALGGGE